MNKNIKLKLTIAITILITFICVISAGWVIAQSATDAGGKKPAEEKEAIAAPLLKIDAPQKVSKIFGTTGRPDPFIVVTGAAAKMSLPSTGPVKPGQSSASQGLTGGYAGAALLTGTFIVNGKKYALIKFGDKTQICQEGTQMMGFKVTKISSKKVTLISKTGPVELKIEDYLTKSQVPNNAQAPASFGEGGKSLVPPPMQAPTETQSSLPGAPNAPAAQQGLPEETQQGGTK